MPKTLNTKDGKTTNLRYRRTASAESNPIQTADENAGIKVDVESERVIKVVRDYLDAAKRDDSVAAEALASGKPAKEHFQDTVQMLKTTAIPVIKMGLLDRKLYPTLSLIATEKMTLSQKNRTREGHLLFTLDHGTIVDIDFESPEGLSDEMRRFREANPSATSIYIPVSKSGE